MHTILIVDPDAEQYHHGLAASIPECRIIVRQNQDAACRFFLRHDVDLVLLDHTSDNPCEQLLEVVQSTAPSVPAIIVTSEGSEELAVSVFKRGARDYLKKPFTVHALHQCIDAALGGNGRAHTEPFGSSSNGIGEAIKYINTNYCLPLKLAHVAHEAGMSVSCFTRSFKKTLGVTFSRYLNKVRIARAIQMMEQDGGFTIGEIAFACGFKDNGYFTKTFKRVTGTSPMEFKRALKANRI
jgi:YesN/AraC family two-component response regulator